MSNQFPKYHSLFFLFFLFPLFLTAQLRLEISPIKLVQGNMFIALYDSEATYMDDFNAVYRTIAPVEQENFSLSIPDLEAGNYAIVIFHDANDNKELDKGLFGIPLEAYGFSNDAKGRFGPPSFSDASVLFSGEEKVVKITLR